ncbi:MAG TPA: hypothetical protein DIW17_03050 [Clostridiales bacterium]|nr:hypothetical protein [Clostridiales bacterium]
MKWILGINKEIAVNNDQIQARRNYIQCVTGAEVSAWGFIQVNGPVRKKYLCCMSNDGIDGTFITAHINDVYNLCNCREICTGKFVVANTCIWVSMSHKRLLFQMMSVNRVVELFFAKQELSVDINHTFRQSTTLTNIGRFGFQTSLSERKLFANRGKGLMEAIRESFIPVSPVILLGD